MTVLEQLQEYRLKKWSHEVFKIDEREYNWVFHGKYVPNEEL